VTHLIPDQYNVRSEAVGFKVVEYTNIPVYADQAARVDAKLQVGANQEELTVSAEDMPLMKTDRSDVATTFTREQVENLPLFSRNFTSLETAHTGNLAVRLAARLSRKPTGWHFRSWSMGNISVALRSNWMARIIKTPPGDNRDQSHPGVRYTNENHYAELRRRIWQALAGVVTVQTRSGAKDFHGSAFEFRRTGWGQARNPFTQPPDRPLPATKWNQFGGSLGGPLIKKSLFFFGDYQGTRRSNGASTRLNVPTTLVRSTCLDPAASLCDLSEYPNPFLTRQPAISSRITRSRGVGYRPKLSTF